MDLNNPVIQLCMEGIKAEFERRLEDARKLYLRAWNSKTDDYEACIAAHYMARLQNSPQDEFRWNREALIRADAVQDDRVKSFYPSLYVNMGRSYELTGNPEEAKRFYKMAEELGLVHQSE